MEMHWYWLIIIYLFLGGLGAGAYLTSFAAERGWLGKNSSLDKVGYYVAAPIVGFGTLLLVFDLGQGLYKPWLLIGLLSNPSSVMTWGVYILSAFIIVGLVKGYYTFKNKKISDIITWAGAGLALATGAYTGLLLAVVKAIPFWNTGIMPVLFVVSALSTGLSLTSVLTHVVEEGKFSEGRGPEAHILLIGVELIVVAIFLGIMTSGMNGRVGQESAELLITGAYVPVFWGLFIGLGLLFPLAVLTVQNLPFGQSGKKAVTEPSDTGRKVAASAEKGYLSYLAIPADISVLVGGFALRALIILAALPIWDGTI